MAAQPESPPSDSLTLQSDGGLADKGVLLLPEYAASLQGWRDVFQMPGEIYFHSFPELRSVRGANLFRIEIVAERRGSYEAIIAFILGAAASGIIGNRSDAAAVWSFRKLVQWYRIAVSTFVREKTRTTDYTKIATALEIMTAEQGLKLEADGYAPDAPLPEQRPLFEKPDKGSILDEEEVSIEDTSINKASVLTERLDQALKQATQPLESSCERLKLLVERAEALLEFGSAERGVIAAPLTTPPPKRDWRSTKIKFERSNRKTGKALFYFENQHESNSSHYCKIIDKEVRKPHNCYTQAFDDDVFIEFWARQTHPEKGRLNLQWEITSKDPGEGMLFSVPPQG